MDNKIDKLDNMIGEIDESETAAVYEVAFNKINHTRNKF